MLNKIKEAKAILVETNAEIVETVDAMEPPKDGFVEKDGVVNFYGKAAEKIRS